MPMFLFDLQGISWPGHGTNTPPVLTVRRDWRISENEEVGRYRHVDMTDYLIHIIWESLK